MKSSTTRRHSANGTPDENSRKHRSHALVAYTCVQTPSSLTKLDRTAGVLTKLDWTVGVLTKLDWTAGVLASATGKAAQPSLISSCAASQPQSVGVLAALATATVAAALSAAAAASAASAASAACQSAVMSVWA